MILSPDTNTLMFVSPFYLVCVLDVSNPQNIAQYQSTSVYAFHSTFSNDSKTLFLVGANFFDIGRLWTRIDLNYTFMQPVPKGSSLLFDKTSNAVVFL